MTFRLTSEKRKKLQQKSRLLGKTESQFLRELLDRELDEKPLSQGLADLKGALSLQGKSRDKWRQEIKQRNWRS